VLPNCLMINERHPLLSAFAEDQGCKAVDEWDRRTLRSSNAPGLRNRSGRFGGLAKEGASVDSAEEMKDSTGLCPWRLHGRWEIESAQGSCGG